MVQPIRLVLCAAALLFPIMASLVTPQPASAATYTVTTTADSGAGSLRWAIEQANGNPGADVIDFNIPNTDPGYYVDPVSGDAWWSIVVASSLPEITDAVVIDGPTQTANRGDTNPGQVGTGGTVGMDNLVLPQYNRPEIELTQSSNIRSGLRLDANDITIRGLAICGFRGAVASLNNAQIYVVGGSNILLEHCLIGTLADGSEPSSSSRTSGIYLGAGASGTVRNNYIGHNIMGIFCDGASNWNITGNEVFRNALRYRDYEGIDMDKGSNNLTLRGNLFRENGGAGIGSYRATGSFIVENNTLIGNGIGGRETSGIRLTGTNNVIRKNVITGNYGAGILRPFDRGSDLSETTTISQNSCYDNGGLGIDLLRHDNPNIGDGVNFNDGVYVNKWGNNGMDFPVITVATLQGNTLHVEGYVGTDPDGTLFNGATVELFIAASDATGYGEGQTYLGDCATGATNSFNCNVDVTGSGIVATDLITATGTDGSGNTSEFGLSAFLTRIENPVLTLEVTPPDHAFAGQNVIYHGVVRNTSSSDAYDTVLVWTLPPEFIYLDSSHSAIYNPGDHTVTYNLGTLSPGAEIHGWISFHIDDGVADGTIADISARLTWENSLGAPLGPATQSSSIVIYVMPTLSLTVTPPTSAFAGDNVLYTGILSNFGKSTAHNTVLVWQLDAKMTFVSSSHSAVVTPGKVTFNLGDLSPGADSSGWITVHIDPATPDGAVLQIITELAWEDQLGNSYGPQQQLYDLSIYDNPQITITKEGPSEATVGSYITYTGTATNVGGGTAHNVTLVDYLPVGMSFVSSSHSAVYDPTARTVTWALGSVNNGVAIPGWVTVRVEDSVTNGSHLINGSHVTWRDGIGNNYGPVTASHEVIAYTNPVLSIDKAGPSYGHPGDTLTYTITVSNSGGLSARNIVLIDSLPTKYTYVSSTPTGTHVNGAITWNLGTLASGAATSVSLSVLVDNAMPSDTPLANIATVVWGDAQGNNYGPVGASATTTIITGPRLLVTKTGPAIVSPGANCAYDLVVSNVGNSDALTVMLTDMLPTEMNYVSCSDNCTYNAGLGVVTWNLGAITSDDSRTVSILLSVSDNLTQDTSLANVANVNWKCIAGDDHGPASGMAVTEVHPHATPTITLAGPATGHLNSELSYALTVTNDSIMTANNVVVQYILPIGFTYVGSDPAGFYADGVVTWNIGNLAFGTSTRVDVTVYVSGVPAGTTLISVGAVVWECPVGTARGPTFDTLGTFVTETPVPPVPPVAPVGGVTPDFHDNVPPTIYNCRLCADVTETTAEICWATDEVATSLVEYWSSPQKLTSPLDEKLVRDHRVPLTELTPGTTYSFRVLSRDKAGNLAISEECSFATLGTPPAVGTPSPEGLMSQEKPSNSEAQTEATSSNWVWLVGGILAYSLLAGLTILLIRRRRTV